MYKQYIYISKYVIIYILYVKYLPTVIFTIVIFTTNTIHNPQVGTHNTYSLVSLDIRV